MLILLLCIRRNSCSLFFIFDIDEFWSDLSSFIIRPTENPNHLSLECVANFFILYAKCFIHKQKGLILLCASNLLEYNSRISCPDLRNNKTARLFKPYEFIKRFDWIFIFFMLCFLYVFSPMYFFHIWHDCLQQNLQLSHNVIKRNKCCNKLFISSLC